MTGDRNPPRLKEMIKRRTRLFAIVLSTLMMLAAGGALLSLDGCGGTAGGAPPPPPPRKIQPVGGVFPENRTPDKLFPDPVPIGRGAGIVQNRHESQCHT